MDAQTNVIRFYVCLLYINSVLTLAHHHADDSNTTNFKVAINYYNSEHILRVKTQCDKFKIYILQVVGLSIAK